jgi:hypothetical protein
MFYDTGPRGQFYETFYAAAGKGKNCTENKTQTIIKKHILEIIRIS